MLLEAVYGGIFTEDVVTYLGLQEFTPVAIPEEADRP
jgi:hypothetical protein